MFEVGQEIELLDVEKLRFCHGYNDGDVYIVGGILPSGDAVDSSYEWILTKNDINKGYARILQDDYGSNRIDIIGQNGNDGEHYNELAEASKRISEKSLKEQIEFVEVSNESQQALDEVHGGKQWFSDLSNDEQEHLTDLVGRYGMPPEGTTHFDMTDCEYSSWAKLGEDGAIMLECTLGYWSSSGIKIDNHFVKLPKPPYYNPVDVAFKKQKQRTPAHELLEAGSKHMKDRASERDTGEERSMKSCVNAFNAMYADIIRANNGNLTEELGWMFMVFLKASRAKGGDYRQDDYEDGAAYFALAGETASVDRQ